MGARDEFVIAAKFGFVTIYTNVVMGVLVAKLPFLLNPILNRIVRKMVSDLVSSTVDDIEMGAFFNYIDTRTNKQGQEWADAAVNNWKVQNSDASKEEKLRAEKEFFNKHKSLVKFNT